jgi:hypothetical protein
MGILALLFGRFKIPQFNLGKMKWRTRLANSLTRVPAINGLRRDHWPDPV